MLRSWYGRCAFQIQQVVRSARAWYALALAWAAHVGGGILEAMYIGALRLRYDEGGGIRVVWASCGVCSATAAVLAICAVY